MKKSILFVSATILLSACSSIGTTQLKNAEPKAPDCRLDVYSSAKEIKRPYEPICMIDSRTGTTAFHDKTASAAIKNAKPLACQCGADAILIEGMETDGMTFMTWGQGKAIIRGIKYK